MLNGNYIITKSFSLGHWYPFFGLLVTYILNFKAKGDPLLVLYRFVSRLVVCVLRHRSERHASSTPANLFGTREFKFLLTKLQERQTRETRKFTLRLSVQSESKDELKSLPWITSCGKFTVENPVRNNRVFPFWSLVELDILVNCWEISVKKEATYNFLPWLCDVFYSYCMYPMENHIAGHLCLWQFDKIELTSKLKNLQCYSR